MGDQPVPGGAWVGVIGREQRARVLASVRAIERVVGVDADADVLPASLHAMPL
jgi:hypothetical protein